MKSVVNFYYGAILFPELIKSRTSGLENLERHIAYTWTFDVPDDYDYYEWRYYDRSFAIIIHEQRYVSWI